MFFFFFFFFQAEDGIRDLYVTGVQTCALPISANLKLAENATLILPSHGQIDRAREEAKGANKIGTTGRGIGPAYEDKVGRRAIRVCDLADPQSLPVKIDNV